MTDQHDSGPLPELSPEQEATVRRLLAEARHDDPIPVEVGDRLDGVLADLADSAPQAPVADLAAHRRRRNAGALLLAAAAVIVGGFFVGDVVQVGGSGDADDDASSSVARESTSDDQAGGAAADQSEPESAKEEPLTLSSQNLERDVQRQLKSSSAANLGVPGPAPVAPSSSAFSCAPASSTAYGVGKFFAAFYDGLPTVLVLRPAEGDEQEAQVLECGTGTPLQSVTVPAR